MMMLCVQIKLYVQDKQTSNLLHLYALCRNDVMLRKQEIEIGRLQIVDCSLTHLNILAHFTYFELLKTSPKYLLFLPKHPLE